jgi:hypothetical protein
MFRCPQECGDWLAENGSAGDTVKVTVVGVDLDIQDVPDAQEENPGGFVALNGSRKKIMLSVLPSTIGPVTFSVAPDTSVEIYAAPTGGEPLGNHLQYNTAAQVPTQLWVKGVAASDGLHDVVLTLDAAPAGQHFSDTVKFTVVGLGHIQCQGQNVDGTTIVLLKGTIYTFTAIPQPAGAGWPVGLPAWSGLASGTGTQKQITFDFSGNGYVLTAQYGNSKTVIIDVIVPQIQEVRFVSGGGGTSYDIHDGEDRWVRDGVNDPGCFKQGGKTAVKVGFHHSKSLTFPTEVQVAGNVDWWDEDTTGGDYVATPLTFGTWWGLIDQAVTSATNTVSAIDHDSVDIVWNYIVPSGTNAWIGGGGSYNLTYYIIWDSPKNGTPNSTVGAEAWAAQHLTKAHLADACTWGHAGSSPSDIADRVCDSLHRGWVHDSPAYTVANMWGIHDTDHGECDELALEMCYVMRCLGLACNLAYANLAAAINSAGGGNGVALCNVHTDQYGAPLVLAKMGDSFWTSNNFQGCAYDTPGSPLRDTICWDTQHNEHGKKYWELGDDKADTYNAPGSPPRFGILYNYHWRQGGGGGLQQVLTGDDHSSCSKTVVWEFTGN